MRTLKVLLLTIALGVLLPDQRVSADTSLDGLQTLVHVSPSQVDDIAVASMPDTDLVIWTSFNQLYGVRVTRSGALVDSAPIELASNVSYPSVASDGQSFLVMWCTPSGDGSNISIQIRFIGRRGDASAVQNVIPTASRFSRPQVTFAGSYFVFAWLASPVGDGTPHGRVTMFVFNRWGLVPQTLISPFDVGRGGPDNYYWTYQPPTVYATDSGVAALSYDYTFKNLYGCQIGACDRVWQYDAKYSLMGEGLYDMPPAVVAPSFLSALSFVVKPQLVAWQDRSTLLWTTDDYVPARYGGDTIRAMAANGRDLPQPAGGEVLFSSTTGAISALDAAVADDALWIVWMDRMRDYEPSQAPRIFIEKIASDGEKLVFPSVENVAIYDVSATNGHVAVAAYVPSTPALGGRLVLVTISEPGRSRAVRR